MASVQIGRKQLRQALFCACCIFIILLGGVVTFLWQVHSEAPTRAAGGDVVGPPTLPAATVNTILARMGSPMVGTGAIVEQASRQTNIDDAFALGVWWTETNDGAAGVGLADRNPGSVRGTAGYPAVFDGYTIYPSYAAAITDWFNLLRARYVNKGLTSAYTICYSYVGTSSSYQWAIKVTNLMQGYHGEAPPPPIPTPTPVIIPTPNAVRIQHTQVHVVKPQPAMLGTTQEAHTTGDVIAPVITQPAVVHAPIAATAPASPPVAIILSSLLAALLIALWGLRLGRGTKTMLLASQASEQPVPAFTEPTSEMPAPLYVNEVSPVLVVQTEQLVPSEVGEQGGQLSPVLASVLGDSQSGGVQKRFADTDALPRRIMLRPVRMQREAAVGLPGDDSNGSAGSSLVRQGSGDGVRDREPELVGVSERPLGLLSRYAVERRGGE